MKIRLLPVLLFMIITVRLYAQDDFIFSGQKFNGDYIGIYLEIMSEKELLKLKAGGLDLSETAEKKLLSGRWKSDRNYRTNLERTPKGYMLEMADRNEPLTQYIEWRITDITENRKQLQFIPCDTPVPLIDFNDHAHWIHFTITNITDHSASVLIELDKYLFSWFDLFQMENGEYTMKSGSFETPLSRRSIPDDHIVHAVSIEPGINDIYMRVESRYSDTVPLRIWSEDIYNYKSRRADSINSVILGIMIFLVFNALFLYFSFYEKAYLFLAALIIFSTMLNIANSGLGFLIIWPEKPLMNTLMLYLFHPLTCFSNILFCRYFLKTGNRTPFLDTVLVICLAASLANAVLQFFFYIDIGTVLFLISLFTDYITVVPLLAASIIILRQGDKVALFLVFGIIFQLLSYVEFWLTSFNVIPLNLLDFLQIRIIGFSVIIFWAIRYRINTMKEHLKKLRKYLNELMEKNEANFSGKPLTDRTKSKIIAVKEYLHIHYNENLSRDILADSVDLSPDHLGRMFKKYTGEKISEYINQLRIEKACHLLEESSDKIINIAFSVGFDSLRTFNKKFSELIGKTPTAYRKEYVETGTKKVRL